MNHGRVPPRAPRALLLASALLTLPPAAPLFAAPAKTVALKAAPAKTVALKAAPAPAARSKNVHPATFVSADDAAVHVTLSDGTALDAETRPSSLFLLNGLTAGPTDFKAGAKVLLRTRTRASDGTVSVVMLSDLATGTVIDSYRRKPLIGHVVSVADKTLVVQPDGPATLPLTLHTTAKTVYRKHGADATETAFPAGSSVTVITRGLPSGLLMASIVSDQLSDAQSEKAALKPISLVGAAVDVQPDKGLLTLAPKTKPRQTVAITDATKIKVEKAEALLRQITPGMRVSARLSRQKDADGHLIATSLSAYAVTPKTPIRKPLATKPH